MKEVDEDPATGIAVVGMTGRFPGANNIDELWKNLLSGKETLSHFSPEELDPSLPQEEILHPDYVPVRGILQNADQFEPAFFGISAREAELMDPQQRIFLQSAWEALECAGYVPESFTGQIGVYAGMANNSYFPTSVWPRQEQVRRFGEFQVMLANEKDFLSTRVSHKLDLKGPSVSLYTGCSTSLVAVCQAFDSLMSYQSDMCLAGGISITCPQRSGYIYRQDGIEAIDGHCRPFDAAASGTIFSNGVGIVVLKRLEDALTDHDHIHAVLRGAALNNDGAAKVSFAAPSVQGQADVITMALAQAEFSPASIGYVEAHGTATQLGDPVEFEGLKKAYEFPRHGSQYCALGSIKSNFGHLLAAAGVTGLIKAILCVERGQIPPTLHFNQANPNIDLNKSPFFINTENTHWRQSDTPRRAAVSSFGIGGTNAHVVLEQAPSIAESDSEPGIRPELLCFSAATIQTLNQQCEKFTSFVATSPHAMADMAWTLQEGRRRFAHRAFVVANSPQQACERLKKLQSPYGMRGHARQGEPQVVFMLPGQGTQYAGMARALYAGMPTFKQEVDACATILLDLVSLDIRSVLFNGDDADYQDSRLAQCTLFVIEYALTRWLMALGIKPRALIGHSLGEWVAACVAEVIQIEDALKFLVERAEVFDAQEPGGMLAVRGSAVEISEICKDGLEIAADNSPNLCAVSGPATALAALASELEKREIPFRQLPANRAFHNKSLQATVSHILPIASALGFARPRIPMVSTLSGTWANPREVTDPAYWARHHSSPVRFREALLTAGEIENVLFLEVGPGRSLSTCASQTLGSDASLASLLLDELGSTEMELESVLHGLGQLWFSGAPLQWEALYNGKQRRVPMPTYPFACQRYWLDAVARSDWMKPFH